MECILPGWASHVTTLLVIAIAGGSALWVMERCSQAGRRRHPAMTFGDQHSRSLWNSLGVFLGVFVTFPVVGWATLDLARAPICEVVGEWREKPSHPRPDFGAMQREIDELMGRY